MEYFVLSAVGVATWHTGTLRVFLIAINADTQPIIIDIAVHRAQLSTDLVDLQIILVAAACPVDENLVVGAGNSGTNGELIVFKDASFES